MVLSEGLSSGNTTRFAFFQSIYSPESWVDQNSLSSSSLLNLGIFLFMGLIYLPFLAVHISCRYHPYFVVPDGEYDEEHSSRIRMPKGIEAVLLFRVPDIVGDHPRPVEKYLLALRWRDVVLLPVLLGIVNVPLEAGAFLKKSIDIHPQLGI